MRVSDKLILFQYLRAGRVFQMKKIVPFNLSEVLAIKLAKSLIEQFRNFGVNQPISNAQGIT
jgi:hypothetical protein